MALPYRQRMEREIGRLEAARARVVRGYRCGPGDVRIGKGEYVDGAELDRYQRLGQELAAVQLRLDDAVSGPPSAAELPGLLERAVAERDHLAAIPRTARSAAQTHALWLAECRVSELAAAAAGSGPRSAREPARGGGRRGAGAAEAVSAAQNAADVDDLAAGVLVWERQRIGGRRGRDTWRAGDPPYWLIEEPPAHEGDPMTAAARRRHLDQEHPDRAGGWELWRAAVRLRECASGTGWRCLSFHPSLESAQAAAQLIASDPSLMAVLVAGDFEDGRFGPAPGGDQVAGPDVAPAPAWGIGDVVLIANAYGGPIRAEVMAENPARPGVVKVKYLASRTAAWVARARVLGLAPAEGAGGQLVQASAGATDRIAHARASCTDRPASGPDARPFAREADSATPEPAPATAPTVAAVVAPDVIRCAHCGDPIPLKEPRRGRPPRFCRPAHREAARLRREQGLPEHAASVDPRRNGRRRLVERLLQEPTTAPA